VLVALEVDSPPARFEFLRDLASEAVPGLVARWQAEV